jgi:hypothetical protein
VRCLTARATTESAFATRDRGSVRQKSVILSCPLTCETMMRNTVPSAISTRKPTTISRGVENLLGNTFSRIVATQGLRPGVAGPGQYTRGRFGRYSRLRKEIQSNESQR